MNIYTHTVVLMQHSELRPEWFVQSVSYGHLLPLSAPIRVQAGVVAVLPGGAGCLVSNRLWNHRMFRPQGGRGKEERLLQDRYVCVCVFTCMCM